MQKGGRKLRRYKVKKGKIKEKNYNKKRAGFTLIEMVIVVAIIGVLSGIAVLKYTHAQKIAKENADYASASVIATASYLSMENGDDKSIYTNPDKLKEKNYIDRVPKVQSIKNSKFKVENSENDEGITVKAGEKTFYPKEEKNAVINKNEE